MQTVHLGDVAVGRDQPPYIIAEIGSNHNGDMGLCRELIDAAAEAGAHAVKFQSWSDRTLVSEGEYRLNTDFSDKKRHFGSLREMVAAYQLTPEQHVIAAEHCASRGITFCSTPFSSGEADLLADLGVPFYKIASMDVVYLDLLRHVARKGKPVIISTGMATLAEIEQAVATVRREGNEQIVLLHCISIYPPDHATINLRNLDTLHRAFGVPVGFSDHSIGVAIPLAAIARGACVVEKHFTLDKDLDGWDHWVSADPPELKTIVVEGAHVFQALGTAQRVVSGAELQKREKFRRSLVARADLPAGHVLQEEDLDAKRPGTAISPDEVRHVLGRRLARPLHADEVIQWSDLD